MNILMTINQASILWIYIVLLLAGGFVGFLKAGSKASIITSSIFSVLLALCALGKLGPAYVADIILAVLLLVFGMRFSKKRKFMPGGMLLVMTALALAAHFLL